MDNSNPAATLSPVASKKQKTHHTTSTGADVENNPNTSNNNNTATTTTTTTTTTTAPVIANEECTHLAKSVLDKLVESESHKLLNEIYAMVFTRLPRKQQAISDFKQLGIKLNYTAIELTQQFRSDPILDRDDKTEIQKFVQQALVDKLIEVHETDVEKIMPFAQPTKEHLSHFARDRFQKKFDIQTEVQKSPQIVEYWNGLLEKASLEFHGRYIGFCVAQKNKK